MRNIRNVVWVCQIRRSARRFGKRRTIAGNDGNAQRERFKNWQSESFIKTWVNKYRSLLVQRCFFFLAHIAQKPNGLVLRILADKLFSAPPNRPCQYERIPRRERRRFLPVKKPLNETVNIFSRLNRSQKKNIFPSRLNGSLVIRRGKRYPGRRRMNSVLGKRKRRNEISLRLL